MYEGKPLVLVSTNLPPDPSRIELLEQPNSYTTDLATGTNGLSVRKMWARFQFNDAAYIQANPDIASWWTYAEQCQPGFKSSEGHLLCDQPHVAVRNGVAEQIAVVAGYGECAFDPNNPTQLVPYSCWASHLPTSVPKWNGKTFFSQFHTVSRYPTAKVVIIAGWNGWYNQRFCVTPTGACPQGAPELFPDSNPVFLDEFDADHNSSFEPGGPDSDLHYRLMATALTTLRPTDFVGHWGTASSGFSFGLEHDTLPWNPLDEEFEAVPPFNEFRLVDRPLRLPCSYTLRARKPS
jgi:hypothetical protein